MAGFRDALIHAYEGVDLRRVRAIADCDLPAVKAAIAAMLPPLDQLEQELERDIPTRNSGNGKT